MYPLVGRGQSARAEVRQHLGPAVQHSPRQRFHFYEELNAVVQHEPADCRRSGNGRAVRRHRHQEGQAVRARCAHEGDPDRRGGGRQRDGARDIFASRDPRQRIFPDRQWITTFLGGSHSSPMAASASSMRAPCSTTTPLASRRRWPRPSPARARPMRTPPATRRASYFDGGKNYKVTLPGPVPAGRFWSFTVYDNQTRSMLETDQATAGLDSTLPGLKKNADGSATVWFARSARRAGRQLGPDHARARAGTSSSASTAPLEPGSTRAGSRAISSW